MNTLIIEVLYSSPKQQDSEFLLEEIQRHIISEFAQNLAGMIEKTECEHCDDYRLRLNVLTDEQLEMIVNDGILKMMLEGQIV